jgi:hypothetical protein
MLVVFVGAGISRLVGCPSWDGFATAVLDQLVPEPIDYHERSLINAIPDPRKRLSLAKIIEEENGAKVDYESIFRIKEPKSDIYKFVNSYQCTFVTTNYDLLLTPDISQSKKEEEWRFFDREQLHRDKLDDRGNVIHLHGCVKNPKKMIITTKDYLEHYASKEVQAFLEYLFKNKTVLFLGYGLEETEILEYILKYRGNEKKEDKRLFILQGFFNAEMSLYQKLTKYYEESFFAELIGFPKDYEEYEQQKRIIEKWAEKLSFSDLKAADEATAMLDELG